MLCGHRKLFVIYQICTLICNSENGLIVELDCLVLRGSIARVLKTIDIDLTTVLSNEVLSCLDVTCYLALILNVQTNMVR